MTVASIANPPVPVKNKRYYYRGSNASASKPVKHAMAETSPNAVAAMAPLSQLHPSTALWCIAKFPVTEIRTRLTAFGLPTDGTKRTLAARLHAHLQTLPAPPESPASTEDGSDHGSAAPSDATGESSRHRRHAAEEKARHGRHAAEEKARHGHRGRRRQGHGRLSREDAETIRTLLRRHDRHHRSRAHNPRSWSRSLSLATTASDLSSVGSPRFPLRRTSTTPFSSWSSGSSPRRSRRRSRGRKRPAHHTPRDRTRKGKAPKRSRHSNRHSRRRRHREDSSERPTGTLPAIPDRVRGRIRRGEFVELDMLLQTNLRASGSGRAPPEGATGPDSRSQRRATINDFTGWSEAWSVNTAVLTAYFPHLALRLFHYQHFLALKSRAFQPSAWLHYDIDFRLKLAANGSWRFDAVDTELWATCFAADGLAMPNAPAPSCYVCQSTTHFYAQCPQHRLAATRPALQPVPPQRPENPRSQRESGNPAGPHVELCNLFNERGRCFRGARCPYTHACAQCGGQHAKRACPSTTHT